MNNYSEFQENIFSNNRDIRLHLENSRRKKGHNFVCKKNGGLPPLLVWVPLLIVNNYSDDADDTAIAAAAARAMTIPQRFLRKQPR